MTPDLIKNKNDKYIKGGDISYCHSYFKPKIHKLNLNEANALFRRGRNVEIIDLVLSYDPLIYDLGEFCYWFAFPWWTREFNDRYYSLKDRRP